MVLTHSNKRRSALRAARENKTLTQDELGRLVGLNPSMIALLELGCRLGSVTTWDKLEAILGVDQKILRQIDKETS